METPKRINSISELRTLTDNEDGVDVFVMLSHFARSSKHISRDGNTWYIYNEIDDTEDTCTDEEMESGRIAEFISKGAMYMYNF